MMLDLKNRSPIMGASNLSTDDEVGKAVSAVRLFIKRRYKMAILLMALGLLAGVAYLKVARPSYAATVIIDIANREGRFLQQQATLTDLPADAERDIAFAKSLTLAEAVVRKLHLDKDPEFGAPASQLLIVLRRLWSGGLADPDAMRTLDAISSVQSRARIIPDTTGSSFEIVFTSSDPAKSATIANAIADAFISSQSEADAQLHKQAADWLVGQSNELANRSKEAATAVSEFIKSNNIVLVDGKLLDQQNLDDVNKRVAASKVKLLDAQYKLDRINASLANAATHDILDATSATEVQDPVIAKGRERYADLSNQLRAIDRDFGKAPQVLQNLMATTKAEILAELSRLQKNALDDYQLLNKNYEESLGEQKIAADAAQRANSLNSQLKDLQSAEQNYRTLYENFLQHSAESARELSFPMRDARIAERAKAPLEKSWPRPFIVLAAAAFGGLALGLGVGALRDFTDGVFRTVSQFEAITQLKCLGVVPNARLARAALRSSALPPGLAERFKRPPLWTKIKTSPNSRFVSELIAVRLALRNSASAQRAQVFGFTSALSGEGKSSLVASLGVLAAQSGQRVVVVDLDLRNPTLTDLFAQESRVGLSDVLAGRRELQDILVRDPHLNLTIVPGAANVNMMQTVELLSSARMRECIAKLRQDYEIVLVDLPPLLPITDVRATTEFIDKYILVVEWAKTNISLVRRALEANPDMSAKLTGGILNKVHFNKLSKYDSLGDLYYMRPEFSRYLDRE